MTETMTSLKKRAARWPDPWGEKAREIIKEADLDLILVAYRPYLGKVVIRDLRESLLALGERVETHLAHCATCRAKLEEEMEEERESKTGTERD